MLERQWYMARPRGQPAGPLGEAPPAFSEQLARWVPPIAGAPSAADRIRSASLCGQLARLAMVERSFQPLAVPPMWAAARDFVVVLAVEDVLPPTDILPYTLPLARFRERWGSHRYGMLSQRFASEAECQAFVSGSNS